MNDSVDLLAPQLIASINGKEARLQIGENTGPRSFNIAQLKPAPPPNMSLQGLPKPSYAPKILHTEIVSEDDPRATLFDDAKRKELQGLLEKNAFKIVLKEEAGNRPNIMPSRFVLAIKHATDGSSHRNCMLNPEIRMHD